MANTKPRVGLNPLAYEGVRAINPPDFVTAARNPKQTTGGVTPLDYNFDIGTLWLNTTSLEVFMLVDKAPSPIATWIQFNAAAGAGINTILDNAGNPVVPTAGGVVTIIGDNAAGLQTVMTGANELTITTVSGTPYLTTLTGNTGGAITGDASANIDFTGALANGITVVGTGGTNSLEIQSRGGNRFIELLSGSSNPATHVTGTAADGLVELESTSAGLTITGDTVNNKIVFTLTGGGGSGGVDLEDNSGVIATPDGSMIIKVQGLDSVGLETVSQIDHTGAADIHAMVVTTASGRHVFEGIYDNSVVATRQDSSGELALVGRTASGIETFSNTDASGGPLSNSISIGLTSGNHILEGLIPDGGAHSPVVGDAAGDITLSGGDLITTTGIGTSELQISLDNGLDGQVIIGSTGGSPAYAYITSLDGTITITNGPNSIDLSAPGGGGGSVNFIAGNAGYNVTPTGGGTISVVGNLSMGLTVIEDTPAVHELEIQTRGGNRIIEILRDDASNNVTATATAGAISFETGLSSLYFDGTLGSNQMALVTASGDEVCLGIETVDDGNFINPTAAGYVRFIQGANVTITGNPGSNSVTISASGGGGAGVSTLTGSSGGTNPVGPDGANNITLTAGSNISITGNSAGNEVIFNVTSGGGAGGTEAFCAHRTGDVANVTGMDVTYTVLFNTVDFDDFGTYAPGTGIFTVPTDGKYIFSAKVLLDNLLFGAPPAFTTSNITILSSAGNSQTKTGFNIDQNASDTFVFDNTAIMELSAGDTVRVQVTIGNNFTNQTVGLVGSAVSTVFCGALLSSSSNILITKFTSSGTWNKNPFTQMVRIMGVGGGAGGGSGARGGSNTGGGGGTGGGYMNIMVPAEFFAASEIVTIGAGGTGGASVAITGDGNVGTAGGNSSVGNYITPVSVGGPAGRGTTTAAVNGLTTDGITGLTGAIRAGQGQSGNGTAAISVFRLGVPSGGGGGAGALGGSGGAGGSIVSFDQTTVQLVGGSGGAPGLNGGNGNNGWDNFGGDYFAGGTGGGGGGSNAGTGGTGGIPGGGGGAGGATSTGTSGAGGDGARGEVWIIEYL